MSSRLAYVAKDWTVMARTVWGESRGQSWRGQVAVAWVIRNRVEADLGADSRPDWWGEGITGVCLAKKQFSCWNPGDPNRALLLAAGPHMPSYLGALTVAGLVILGQIPDPTRGATHYHTVAKPSWADVWPPSWTRVMGKPTRIDDHAFYRDTAMPKWKDNDKGEDDE